MTNWERWIKRYVWDDERTPYLVSPGQMTQSQARYEIFAYAVFLSCLFFIASLASASSLPAMFYTLSVLAAAIILGFTKHSAAAAYCATAPIAAAFRLAVGGFQHGLGTVDAVFIILVIILWAAYGFRVISITKAYEDMKNP